MLPSSCSDKVADLSWVGANFSFVYWNRKLVDWAVGIAPVPLFAKEAIKEIDLAHGRRSISSMGGCSPSIDVLEHLPLPDFKLYLSEAATALSLPASGFPNFSNTREGSRLDFIVRTTRRLSKPVRRAVAAPDDSRDRLRKSDHVKAVETYPQLDRVLNECGWWVEKGPLGNGLFQSLIENLLVKTGRIVSTQGWTLPQKAEARHGSEQSQEGRGRAYICLCVPPSPLAAGLTEPCAC